MLHQSDLFSLSHGGLFSLKLFLVDSTLIYFSNQAGWMKLNYLKKLRNLGLTLCPLNWVINFQISPKIFAINKFCLNPKKTLTLL